MTIRASIRRHVLVLALAAVALVWAGTAVFVYFDARHEINEAFDAHLAQTAALLVTLSGGETVQLAAAHAPRLDRHARHVAFQVWQGDRLLVHSQDAPDEPLATVTQGYSERMLGSRRWRVFSTRSEDGGHVIHVGERRDARDEIARDTAVNVLSPLLYALPLLAVVLWVAVARGMRPLSDAAREVSSRDSDRLAPLEIDHMPREIRPLVEQINQLFARIDRSLENERRFTADAAHELRTPVAAIKAQAQVALGVTGTENMKEGLRKVVAGCDRAAHLVDQLLVLARVDRAVDTQRERCPLRALCEQAIADVASYAIGKDVQLELEPGNEVEVTGVPSLISILIRNLVDNAARYSSASSVVTVRVAEDAGFALVQVTDQGPGIPAADREQVFQRFYRGLGTGEEGSGLGLSIVHRIAQLHGAAVSLESGVGDRGLAVTVRFPNANQGA